MRVARPDEEAGGSGGGRKEEKNNRVTVNVKRRAIHLEAARFSFG
jgi:hypothetical protein